MDYWYQTEEITVRGAISVSENDGKDHVNGISPINPHQKPLAMIFRRFRN
jgi:hypothetical protein